MYKWWIFPLNIELYLQLFKLFIKVYISSSLRIKIKQGCLWKLDHLLLAINFQRSPSLTTYTCPLELYRNETQELSLKRELPMTIRSSYRQLGKKVLQTCSQAGTFHTSSIVMVINRSGLLNSGGPLDGSRVMQNMLMLCCPFCCPLMSCGGMVVKM